MPTDSPALSPLSPALAAVLADALARPAQRVAPLDVQGRRYWLKRPERHKSWVRRLQKGDPARALEAEREGLHALSGLDLPVLRIAAEGADFLLLEDAGRSITAGPMRRRWDTTHWSSCIRCCRSGAGGTPSLTWPPRPIAAMPPTRHGTPC